MAHVLLALGKLWHMYHTVCDVQLCNAIIHDLMVPMLHSSYSWDQKLPYSSWHQKMKLVSIFLGYYKELNYIQYVKKDL